MKKKYEREKRGDKKGEGMYIVEWISLVVR